MTLRLGYNLPLILSSQLTALIGFIALSVFAKNIEMLLVGQIFCGYVSTTPSFRPGSLLIFFLSTVAGMLCCLCREWAYTDDRANNSFGVFETLTVTYAAELAPVTLRPYLTAYVNLCWVVGEFREQ